jgi:UPF0755 protein
MRLIRDLWWVLLSYAVFLACYGAWMVWDDWMQPVSSDTSGKVVTIPQGSTFSWVARRLEEEGLIRSQRAFSILAWWKEETGRIRTGEYMLSPSQKPKEILKRLVTGKTLQHMVTIPEGFCMYDIARLLNRSGLISRTSFLKAATDRDLLDQLGVSAESAEGYLYPDTYYLTRGLTAKEVVRSMVRRFWKVWETEGFEEKADELDVDVHQITTLASIVEEEAMLPPERPEIAGVFWNRLRKDMPLQADPTVLYGIMTESKETVRRLRWKDLKRYTPYNTYVIKGLPKGPICNPGKESMRAVLWPADTDNVYFVSKNNGAHHFSKTLSEHNKAVDLYQRGKSRKSRSDAPAAPPPAQPTDAPAAAPPAQPTDAPGAAPPAQPTDADRGTPKTEALPAEGPAVAPEGKETCPEQGRQ